MARNSEKAQSMLFRFREAQAADLGILSATRGARRPRSVASVDAVPAAEKWRGQVLKEISRKMSRIQESSLSDFQVRDLNDELNRLLREKLAWEARIRDLGGPNYARAGAGGGRVYDEQGREVPGGGRGYRYFGRARELPGVRELFEAAARRAADGAARPLEKRADLRRNVDAAYYGYGAGGEDAALLAYEAAKEAEAAEALAGGGGKNPPEGWEPLPGDAGDGRAWELPTLGEVDEELIDRRRRKLLDELQKV